MLGDPLLYFGSGFGSENFFLLATENYVAFKDYGTYVFNISGAGKNSSTTKESKVVQLICFLKACRVQIRSGSETNNKAGDRTRKKSFRIPNPGPLQIIVRDCMFHQ
jgi:hypothetical protein